VAGVGGIFTVLESVGLIAERVVLVPGSVTFEGAAGAEDYSVVTAPPDDLSADRHSVDESARN
jgi:hypothetical protein